MSESMPSSLTDFYSLLWIAFPEQKYNSDFASAKLREYGLAHHNMSPERFKINLDEALRSLKKIITNRGGRVPKRQQ